MPKILVLDDESDIPALTEVLLKNEGYGIVTRKSSIIFDDIQEIYPEFMLSDVRFEGGPERIFRAVETPTEMLI